MDLLDRLLGHDAWTTAELLRLSSPLTDTQLDQDFDIGHRTLRATLQHVIRNVEVWTDLMAARPVRPRGGNSIPDLTARAAAAHADLATFARSIAARGAWDERWTDTLDDPPRDKSYGAAIAHVITHSMHHRAQVLYLLRRLGVTDLPEGDVFSWENQTLKLPRTQ